MHKITLLALCLLTVTTACKKGHIDTGNELNLTPTEQQKVSSDNAFTLKLFKTVVNQDKGEKNVLLSPLSVSFAFGMTSNGAAGQTLTGIYNTMNFTGFTESEINGYYSKLITQLPQLDPKTTLKIANSIWYKNTFTPIPAFLQSSTDNYKTTTQALDFTSPSAKETINGWVNTQTDGKIPAIINDIPDNAVMYLVNAIYFKSAWKDKFDPADTKSMPFTLANNSVVQANFMKNNSLFKAAAADDAVVVELPYSNSKYSMVLIMPSQGVSLKQYAAGLDSDKWQNLIGKLTDTQADISLPKFKFSYGITLNDVLINLGMGDAFSNHADFSRINADAHLAISDVEHKTFIEVNEDGTEAAAATSVGVGATSAPLQSFTFNRPFIFAIREMKTGLVLFAGTINNPLVSDE